jgi:hypothetical protein
MAASCRFAGKSGKGLAEERGVLSNGTVRSDRDVRLRLTDPADRMTPRRFFPSRQCNASNISVASHLQDASGVPVDGQRWCKPHPDGEFAHRHGAWKSGNPGDAACLCFIYKFSAK